MAAQDASASLLDTLASKGATLKLSQTLASRLKFAGFKVMRGLQDKSFHEVAAMVDSETMSSAASSVDSPYSARSSMSPSSKRFFQGEAESPKRARVSVSPEHESEAVELLMALSAHSTRASASPEPVAEDDERPTFPSPSATEVPLAAPPPDEEFTEIGISEQPAETSPRLKTDKPSAAPRTPPRRRNPRTAAGDPPEEEKHDIQQIAETMVSFVMSPGSPSGGSVSDPDASRGTSKVSDSEQESSTAPSPPPQEEPVRVIPAIGPGPIAV